MDRKAFIERANKWSKNRYGVTVSNRSLDDWVSEGLIPGPTRAAIPGKRGSQRIWSARSYYRLLRICRMKRHKGVTFDQIRIYLWLRSNDAINDPVRHSMEKECKRLFTDIWRPLRTVHGPSDNTNQTEKIRLGKKRLKKVDPRLGSFSELIPPWLFKDLTDAALFSTSSFSDMPKIVEFIVTLLSGIQILDTGDMGDKISELAMMLKTSFQGFFDLPEDGEKSIPGSGMHSLQTATSDIFYECRSFCKIKQKLLNFIPPIISNIAGQELQIKEATDVISSSMQDYRWSFGIFLLMLHAVSRSHIFRQELSQAEGSLRKLDLQEVLKAISDLHAADA